MAAPSAQSSSLLINEIMQSNVDGLVADSDFPDSWVELYNPTSSVLSLQNYRLGTTDDAGTAYRLSGSIPAHGYALVYCDKVSKGMHTDFNLDCDDPGRLYLFDSNQQVVDRIDYPRMLAPGVGYGRTDDGGSTWQYVRNATPGASNAGGRYADQLLPDPLFSLDGQLMTSAAQLQITLPSVSLPADVRIYYTLDGSEPTSKSPSATQVTLDLKRNTTVRAKLISQSALSPRSVTHSYLFADAVDDPYRIVSIVTSNDYLYDGKFGIISNYEQKWRRPINIEVFDPRSGRSTLNQLCETAVAGHGSRTMPQKSLKCYAKKRFGKKQFNAMLWSEKPRVTHCKSFVLRSGGNRSKETRINDAIVQRLFGWHVPNLDYQAYTPVIVYINGQYKGFYEMRERSDEDFVEANYPGIGDVDVEGAYSYYANRLEGPFREFRDLYSLQSTTFADLAPLMDVDNFLKALIAEIYAFNFDYPNNNIAMWRPLKEGGRWRWILKDLDAMGVGKPQENLFSRMFDYGYGEMSAEGEYVDGQVSTLTGNTLYRKMISLPEFRRMFIDHYAVYLGDFLRGDYVSEFSSNMFDEIEPQIPSSNEVYGYKMSSWDFYRSLYNDFVSRRPEFEYANLSRRFNLGYLLPMQVTDSGHHPTINGISLTAGDFRGCWFSNHPLLLESGSPFLGWRLTISPAAGIDQVIEYSASSLSLSLADFPEGSSLLFEPYSIGDDPGQGSCIEQIGLSDDDASQSNASTTRPPLYYNLLGQPVRQLRRGEHGFLIPIPRR